MTSPLRGGPRAQREAASPPLTSRARRAGYGAAPPASRVLRIALAHDNPAGCPGPRRPLRPLGPGRAACIRDLGRGRALVTGQTPTSGGNCRSRGRVDSGSTPGLPVSRSPGLPVSGAPGLRGSGAPEARHARGHRSGTAAAPLSAASRGRT